MAQMYEGITCAVCKKEVNDRPRDTFATSGIFFPHEHRLFKFCDAPMHWDCYERWPDRIEFAQRYFQMWVEAEKGNPYWGKAFLSEKVFVTVNPRPGVAEIGVRLAETGSDIRVPLKLWNVWIKSKWIALNGLHPLEQKALCEAWSQLTIPSPKQVRLQSSNLIYVALRGAEKGSVTPPS